MLYADFDSILKPVDEHFREKMNQMKTGKAPYTDKINTHASSECCAVSTFSYKDVIAPLKMCNGRDCVDKFVEYIED